MTTVIEKDSPVVPLLLIAAFLLVLLGGGLGLAYVGGVFTGKNEMVAKNKRTADQAPLSDIPTPLSAPAKP